jgi:hypothetical protein
MAGWFADVLIEWLIRLVVRAVRKLNSMSWPVVDATVTNARCERASYGCHVADVFFDYSFRGQDFSGIHEEPFLIHSVGEDYANRFVAGRRIRVRVKPAHPETTVAFAD